MNRRTYLRLGGTIAASGLAGCTDRLSSRLGPSSSVRPRTVDGVAVPGRVGERGFEVPDRSDRSDRSKRDDSNGDDSNGDDSNDSGSDDGWRDLLVRGVNMGIAKPGRFPGETAITQSEYARWFERIAAMNANAIRVYTIHPPGFYEALAEHNRRADSPLYLFHGNWLTEAVLEAAGDVYATDVTAMYEQSMRRTVDLIHGNLSIPDRPGHAGGTYETDVSPYVLGYIVGIEWAPEVVSGTNEAHPDAGEFEGTYVRTEGASAFERWLAARLDSTATYEAEKYNTQRPLSFTNWVTTDPLTHPAEPHPEEDSVSVDPNHLSTTDAHHPGLFASYHVYPYYPDFLNYERRYTEHEDDEGEKSTYAGYLTDLVATTDDPLLVAEFGVPASRGKTHSQVYGRDQGHHTETEQGEIDAALFDELVSAGAAGGLVFSWQDEWFKRTWNTMDYSNPDRRPFWSDYQTCEQYFGLLAFDPGEELEITLSGNRKEWTDTNRLYGRNDSARRQNGPLQGMRASADERYLYIRIEYADLDETWDSVRTALLFDTTPDRGITGLDADGSLQSERGIDFVALLGGSGANRVLVDSHYDLFYYQYGAGLGMIPQVEYAARPDNGMFHPIRLALNKELRIPDQNRVIPFESDETGRLRRGVGDPNSEKYDSLADFYVDRAGNAIELRLPWLLLNFRDPSTREIVGDPWETGLDTGEQVGDIRIGAVAFEPPAGRSETALDSASGVGRPAIPMDARVLDSLPARRDETLGKADLARFAWDTWDQPTYHERLKQSYYVLKRAFGEYAD